MASSSSSSSSYIAKKGLLSKPEDIDKKMLDAIQHLTPQPFSTKHLVAYGGPDYNQENFITYHRESVLFGLNFASNLLHSSEDALTLFNLLAEKRNQFAKLHQHVNAEEFGCVRKEAMETPIAGEYDRFALPVQIPDDKEEEFGVLTEAPGIGIMIDSYHCTQKTLDYWTHISPPINYLEKGAELFFELFHTTFPDKETAAKKIASFHWRMANWMPWERGSAAIIDQLIDILWVKHFQWAPEKIAGNSLDCEALSEPDEEKYIENYLKYRPRLREVDYLSELLSKPLTDDKEKEKYYYNYVKYSIHRHEYLAIEKNAVGQTLWEVAEKAGRLKVASYLKDRGASLQERMEIETHSSPSLFK